MNKEFERIENIKGITKKKLRYCNVGITDERDFCSTPLRLPQVV
jgi:hypothetical protein